MEIKKNIIFSVLCGIIILIIGFGMMNLFWSKTLYDSNLPGLYDYYAACWGDRVCLPIIVMASVLFVRLKNNLTKKQIRKSLLFAGIAGIIGVFIQAEWLINNNTKPNWTIPKAHFFTAAGWYHAVFFVFMFFLLTLLFSQIYMIRHNNWIEKNTLYEALFEKILMFTIWTFGSAFLFLVTIDDYCTPDNYIMTLSLAFALFGFLAFIFCFSSNMDSLLHDIFYLSAGSFSAYSIALLIVNNKSSSWALVGAFMVLFLSISYVKPEFNKGYLNFVFSYLSIGIPGFFLSLYAFSNGGSRICVYYLIIMIFVLSLLSACNFACMGTGMKGNEHPKFIITGFLFVICSGMVILSVFQMFGEISSDIYNFFCTGLIGTLAVDYITDIFSNVVNEEDKIALKKIKKEKLSNENSNVKYIVYTCIGFVVLGALLFLFVYLLSISGSGLSVKVVGLSSLLSKAVVSIVIFVLSILLLVILGGKSFSKRTKIGRWLALITTSIAYGSLCAFLIQIKYPFDYSLWIGTNYAALFMVLGVPIILGMGFLYNSSLIRNNIETDSSIRLGSLVIIIGLFVFMLLFIMPFQSNGIISSPNTNFAIIFLFSVLPLIIALGVLPFLLERCIFDNEKYDKQKQLVDNTPLDGVLQDGFTLSVVVLFACVIPITYGYTVQNNTKAIFGYLMLAIYLCWAVTFCLDNNKNHIRDLRGIYANNKSYSEQYYYLKEFLKLQNRLTIFIILPYSVIIVLKWIYQRFVLEKMDN